MHLEVTTVATVVCAAHPRAAGVACDPGPCGTTWMVPQGVPVAREGVGRAGEVKVKVAVMAAVAGAPATAVTSIAGEVAALMADQRAWVAVVVDHDRQS